MSLFLGCVTESLKRIKNETLKIREFIAEPKELIRIELGLMSEWWKTAKDILKGKAKGSKLIILGVFLAGVGVTIEIAFQSDAGVVFWMLGIIAFMRGVYLYEEEVRDELAKKRRKDAQK